VALGASRGRLRTTLAHRRELLAAAENTVEDRSADRARHAADLTVLQRPE
jgi:hypothetical protein